MTNGNGKVWVGVLSIICLVFGLIIGNLRSQVVHNERYVTEKEYERELNELRAEMREDFREVKERLDKLMEFHTRDGG